jgi:hypothetical protein
MFLLDLENRAFVEGRTQRIARPHSAAFLWLTFAMTLPGLGLAAYGEMSWVRDRALDSRGREVQGNITERQMSKDEDGTSYRVHYSYRVEGKTYAGSSHVSYQTFMRSEKGSPVRLRTLSEDPGASKLADDPASDEGPQILVVGVLWLVISSLIFLHALAESRLLRRLEIEGRITDGTILGFKSWFDSESGTHAVVRYRFKTSDGRTLEGRRRRTLITVHWSEPPEVGTPIKVVYVATKHWLL